MKQLILIELFKLARYLNPPFKRYPHRDYPALDQSTWTIPGSLLIAMISFRHYAQVKVALSPNSE